MHNSVNSKDNKDKAKEARAADFGVTAEARANFTRACQQNDANLSAPAGSASDALNLSSNRNLIFVRLAFQNLLRRPTRTLLLMLAVAIGSAAVFSTVTVSRGIQSSINQSFARMGADLVIVPEKTMVNITSSLLTVQPTDAKLDSSLLDRIARLDGVAQAAPQTIYRVPIMAGMPEHKANLIAFDPARDFTVMPWLVERLDRPMQAGDLISGGRRSESKGEEVQPCKIPSLVYGKLGRTGVGPFDDSFFATYETVEKLVANESELGANEQKITGIEADRVDASSRENSSSAPTSNEPDSLPARAKQNGISAILIKLKFGSSPEQVRFAIANTPGVKVISGQKVVASTRETTNMLLTGVAVFISLMIVSSMLLVGLLYSGIISERRREIGLLRAIGSKRSNIAGMLTSEAGFTTALGGICGIVLGGILLLGFQHSLVFYLQSLHIDFAWPKSEEIAGTALICFAVATLVGIIGAIIPAWRSSSEDPYNLIQGEDSSC